MVLVPQRIFSVWFSLNGTVRDQLVNMVEHLAAEEPEVSPQGLVETKELKEEGILD